MLRFSAILLSGAIAIAAGVPASAANVDHGRALAQTTCANCHGGGAGSQKVVADAPPFDVVAKKYGGNADMLATALLNPHPKMNLTVSRSDVADIAAYLATLAK